MRCTDEGQTLLGEERAANMPERAAVVERVMPANQGVLPVDGVDR